jgi:hypothetical protein
MCPHATTCVLILVYMPGLLSALTLCVLILLDVCPHTTRYVSSYYYMCPHTSIYARSFERAHTVCPHTIIYVSSYYYICVLILLYTTCVLILQYVSSYYYMCHHTNICVLILLHVSAYYYICVLILLYMCPHTTICVLILLHMPGLWSAHTPSKNMQPSRSAACKTCRKACKLRLPNKVHKDAAAGQNFAAVAGARAPRAPLFAGSSLD